jgi:hypothetical protein
LWLKTMFQADPRFAGAAPVVAPPSPWMVLFGLFGAALTAYHWTSAWPAKPLATFLVNEARGIGLMLLVFTLPGVLARRNPFPDLRNFVFPWAPLFLVGLVPPIASLTVGWEGGGILALAGLAAGAGAGAATGWLFTRWTLPDIENRPRQRAAANQLPSVFAVLFALVGAYNWGIEWLTLDHAWVIGVGWILLALTGALVGRPLLGLLVMSPFVLVLLVPVVASLTVGWEGGWILGIAGLAVGAAAGAVNGWMFNRWIMPEYDKRRARESTLPEAERLERIDKLAATLAPWVTLGCIIVLALGCIIGGFVFPEWRIIWFVMAGFLCFAGIGVVLVWHEEK